MTVVTIVTVVIVVILVAVVRVVTVVTIVTKVTAVTVETQKTFFKKKLFFYIFFLTNKNSLKKLNLNCDETKLKL